jgi:signal peptidase I
VPASARHDGNRLGTVAEAVAASVTLAAVTLTAATIRPGSAAAAAAIGLALLWGAAGIGADLLARVGTRAPASVPREADGTAPADQVGSEPAVTAVVRLGEVPDEVARTTVAVAAEVGPTILVVAGRDTPDWVADGVEVVHAEDPASGLADAVAGVRTEATLVLSARALPCGDACRAAAALLTGGTSEGADGAAATQADWVIGRCEPLNDDRFGPGRRDAVDAGLRHRVARSGLWLWENDATLVRTELLQQHPPAPGRPLGRWLRERAADGAAGLVVEDTLSLRAAPVSARRYWPDTQARQRAAVADLSDATRRSSSARHRLLGAALLARALSGWTLVLWLAALVLVSDGLPTRVHPVAYVPLLLAGAAAPWAALRLSLGLRPSLVGDGLAALYAVPGSIAATGAALSGRVRPTRVALPSRPLVWVALVATVVAANGLLAADPGGDSGRVAALASVALLVLLWMFTVRSLVERTWERTGFRVPLDLPATITSHEGWHLPVRIVDGSAGGIAVSGEQTGLGPGDEVTVEVDVPHVGEGGPGPDGSDGSRLSLTGTVVARRHRDGHELLGVELRAVGPDPAVWATTLVQAARHGRPGGVAPVRERTDPGMHVGAVLDRTVLGAVVVTSLGVVAVLGLVLLGFRPLVVRSGSMVPTFAVGDLVLVDTVRAADLRPGEVATRFDAPETADSLTHRVRAVSVAGDRVVVETRGDANTSSEVWEVPADTPVGVVVASVPLVGRPATLVRTSGGWMAAAAALVTAAVVTVLLAPRARRHGVRGPRTSRPGRRHPVA